MISLADIAIERAAATKRREETWAVVCGVVMGRIVPDSAEARAQILSAFEGYGRELEALAKLELELISHGRPQTAFKAPAPNSAPETPAAASGAS